MMVVGCCLAWPLVILAYALVQGYLSSRAVAYRGGCVAFGRGRRHTLDGRSLELRDQAGMAALSRLMNTSHAI
jgi:hypothetical protein